MNHSRILKTLSAFCLLAGLNSACLRDKAEQQNADSSSDDIQDSLLIVDNEQILLWEYDAEGDSMIKHDIPSDINSSAIIASFNLRYDSIPLSLVRVSQDTIFLKIADATYLTQRIGTTGANGYMSGLVFSLTEIPEIKWVNFEFEAGDHASPGLYTRENFNMKL